MSRGLHFLVVDDERPALEELEYLLLADGRVGRVSTAADGLAALRALNVMEIDAVFLDIRMPGLSGLDLAKVLSHFERPPRIVFVTAYETHALDAFGLQAVDYLLKPVRPRRLAEAVRRVVDSTPRARALGEDETIPIELAGVTRFVRRSDVRYAEAHGDYARLDTPAGSHLVRISLTALEERWRAAGFVRIHRSHLVALAHIKEIRVESGRCAVRVGDRLLAVSRRNARQLRDQLAQEARFGGARP
jgi:DNA-binding LytR/AlgR family response regulator